MADDRVPEDLQTPQLPEIEVVDAADVVDGAIAPEEVVAEAEPAEAIIDAQPSVDELLGRDGG